MAFNGKPRTVTEDRVCGAVIADMTVIMSLPHSTCTAWASVLANRW